MDTCWDQHRHVFDVIVKSNGWDDETATLQLLVHWEGGGDALSVALLVPETQRDTRSGLVDALRRPLTITENLRELARLYSRHN